MGALGAAVDPTSARRPRRTGDRRVERAVQAVALAAAGALLWRVAAWRLVPGMDAGRAAVLTAWTLAPLAVAMTVILAAAARDGAIPGEGRRAWRWLAAATATWCLAGVVWELCDRAPLSWADPVQLLYFPLVLAGVLAVPAVPMDRGAQRRFLLDAGIVVVSGSAAGWYLVVWPVLARGGPEQLARLVNAVYPVLDLGLLFAAGAGLLRPLPPGSVRALAWVAAAAAARFVGDLAFAWAPLHQRYTGGGFIDFAWIASGLALSAAACTQRRHAGDHRGAASGVSSEATDAAAAPTGVGTTIGRGAPVGVLPYLGVVVLHALLVAAALREWTPRTGGVLAAAVAVTGLVLVRQYVAARDHARLERAHAARAGVQAGEARFRALVQHSSDVIVVVDGAGAVRYVSPSVERLLALAPDAVLGRPIVEFLDPDDRAAATARLGAARATPGAAPLRLRVRRPDGACRTVECAYTDLSADPAVGGVVITARDVTERAELEARLAHQAFHDPGTGLGNRLLLRDRVEHALARRSRGGGTVAVLVLDLADFRSVNDTRGHAAGDRLLAAVADRLRASTRAADTLARVGGDEFAVLLDAAGDAAAVEAAAQTAGARLLEALARPLDVDGGAVIVEGSVGVACAGPDDDADALLRNADVALARAKQQGKGALRLFRPEMHAEAVARLALAGDLRRALAPGGDGGADPVGLTLAFQPIVALASGRPYGVEALLRWHHPAHGAVSPATFVPLAEATGLIVPLGRWVLAEACRQVAGWAVPHEPDDLPLTLTVNVSGRQLQDPGFVGDVEAALAASGLAPGRLVLEITETAIMQDTAATLARLAALKALGVRLAIDDFGTGYSSLAYLQQFPVDILKLDKRFVDGVAEPGHDAALALTIIALGDALALRVVAEGIETEAQRRALVGFGCPHGQGYLFARPMSGADAERLLAAGGTLCPTAIAAAAP